jgi:hypothetical protein
MRKNVAGQVVGAQMVNASDGSSFTGAVTCYVTGDNGTQAVGTVGSGACGHKGNGFHTYSPSQAETNHSHVAFTFVATGAITATVQVFTGYPQTGDAYALLGTPTNATLSDDVAAVIADLTEVMGSLQNAAITIDSGGLTGTISVYEPGTAQTGGNLLRTIPISRISTDNPFSLNRTS